MSRWSVPYESPARTMVRSGLAAVFTLFALMSLGVLVLDGPWPLRSWIATVLFMAVFVTLTWRITLVGVWIGEQGVKVRMVLRTRVVRWPDLDRVWLGPATGYDALALWISDRKGLEVETPLWRAGTRARHKNRRKLDQHQLSTLMDLLRRSPHDYERRRQASSFGAAAAAYAEHRPDYAPAAVSWVLAAAPGPRVLDLGAGTGKLTATLVGLGADVVAVEPDPAMLGELRRALPAVRARSGSAESIPLPDASVDAVLAGNALHWFDMATAGPEIARVLAPGGILAGLWNVMDDRLDWITELAQVSGSAVIGPRDTLSHWRTATDISAAAFGSPERAEFPHGQHRTADSLVATLATRAGLLVMPDPQRQATLIRIRTFLATRPETATGEFTLPMLTGVLLCRRK